MGKHLLLWGKCPRKLLDEVEFKQLQEPLEKNFAFKL